MVCVPEAIAIQQGLIPAKGFGKFVNTITQRGKSNVAGIPFLLGYLWFEYKYFSGWRKEVKGRRTVYNERMSKINEECAAWKAAGRVMPSKLLVENEKKLDPTFKDILV